MNLSNRHSLTTMLLITQEQNTQQDAIADLFIFLIRYSFLFFNEPSSGEEILKRDFPYHGKLSSQNPNGARYLDPKYSRWISVDPALGEYVPQAPVNDEAKKHNQNLPGMGGVFNSVNLSLYHYAGNNPVKYVDPNGRVIKIEESDGEDFRNDVQQSIEYLKKTEYGKEIINNLETSPMVFVIKKCDWKNLYDRDMFDGDRTIYWSPRHTILAANGNYNSPAIALMHELTHAWEKRTLNGQHNFYKFMKQNELLLKDFSLKDIKDEFATIIEQRVAQDLGEPAGRKNYDDIYTDRGFSETVILPPHMPCAHSQTWRK